MKKLFKNKFDFYLLILLLVAFLFYAFNTFLVWLPAWHQFGHLIFNWPDANANYFFSNLFATSNHLSQFEPLNILTDNLLHTRSINVWQGNLVPMTFLTPLIIFGLVAKIFGTTGILLLTPVLATISIFLFYKIIFQLFSSQTLAFVSAFLLAFLAPWLFFANVVMLPNILFIFCLLASLYFFLCFFELKYFILSSIFFSLTLMIRPNECIWLAVLFLFLYFYQKNKITLQKISIFVFINLVFILAILFLNKYIYGNIFNFGYLNLQSNTLSTEFSNSELNIFKIFKLLILPFGFQAKVFFSNIYHYLFLLIWPYYILVFISLWSLRKKILDISSFWSKYLLFCFVISLLIVLYYANWDLADDLVKTYNTISISYVRYFLPIYILLIPFVAQGILFLAGKKKWRHFIITFLVFLLSIFSLQLAFLSPNDGLLKNKENITTYYQYFTQVKNIVSENAVIITDRSDKIFFPSFSVVVPQGDLPLWPRIASLLAEREVFYFTDQSDLKLAEINEQASAENLELIEMSQIDQNFRLFIVIKN